MTLGQFPLGACFFFDFSDFGFVLDACFFLEEKLRASITEGGKARGPWISCDK